MLSISGVQETPVNKSKTHNSIFSVLILTTIAAYFLWVMIPRLNDNLWNDEIYTLKYFTFVPFLQTLTYYPVPNNHIFYNLCDNAYLRLIGVNQLKTVLEHPWILRLPLLLLSLFTILFTYKTARLVGGIKAGILAAAILSVTIGYQNFCLQVRGYPFSQFFVLLLIFATLAYLFKPKKIYPAIIAFATFAALYSIPSNLYPVLAVLLFLAVEILSQKLAKNSIQTKYVICVAFIIIGISLAFLCYLPVLKEVTNNPYVNGEPPFDKTTFPQLLSLGVYQFVMDRHFFVFILWSSLTITLLALMWQSSSPFSLLIKILFFQTLTPAALILLQGQDPPDRTFAYAAPVIAVCTGVTIVLFMTKLFSNRFGYVEVSFLSIFLMAGNQVQLHSLKETMDYNVTHGIRIQHLYRSYFSFDYHPLEVTRYLKEHSNNGRIPILLRDSEPYDLPEYFSTFQIPYHSSDSLDYFLRENKMVYVVTRYPIETESIFKNRYHVSIDAVMEPSYHHILAITRK